MQQYLFVGTAGMGEKSVGGVDQFNCRKKLRLEREGVPRRWNSLRTCLL